MLQPFVVSFVVSFVALSLLSLSKKGASRREESTKLATKVEKGRYAKRGIDKAYDKARDKD